MNKPIIKKDQKYYRLLMIEIIKEKIHNSTRRTTFVICKCDCGNIKKN